MRTVVAEGRRDELHERLLGAQAARRNLPDGVPPAEELAEVRVRIPDQPGELAAATTLASELSVNVYDIEVAHAAGAGMGNLILVVDARRADDLAVALAGRGRAASVHPLA